MGGEGEISVRFSQVAFGPRPRCYPDTILGRAYTRSVVVTTLLLATGLSGCSSGPTTSSKVSVTPSVSGKSQGKTTSSGSLPKGGGVYKVGKPYTVKGRIYVPEEDPNYDVTGVASWYGAAFHGRTTANGETFDMNALTAGHPTLPMPTYAYVTNLANGRTIMVRINDRGPYVTNRIIDLSARAASVLGFSQEGLARVRVRYAGKAPLDGDETAEHRFLMAQSWYKDGTKVASLSGIDRLLESMNWSVAGYRQELTEPDGTVQRSGLIGSATLLEVGPFESRSEAERMCHSLRSFGPATVESAREGRTEAFRVRAGPYKDETSRRAAQWIADSGFESPTYAGP